MTKLANETQIRARQGLGEETQRGKTVHSGHLTLEWRTAPGTAVNNCGRQCGQPFDTSEPDNNSRRRLGAWMRSRRRVRRGRGVPDMGAFQLQFFVFVAT